MNQMSQVISWSCDAISVISLTFGLSSLKEKPTSRKSRLAVLFYLPKSKCNTPENMCKAYCHKFRRQGVTIYSSQKRERETKKIEFKNKKC